MARELSPELSLILTRRWCSSPAPTLPSPSQRAPPLSLRPPLPSTSPCCGMALWQAATLLGVALNCATSPPLAAVWCLGQIWAPGVLGGLQPLVLLCGPTSPVRSTN